MYNFWDSLEEGRRLCANFEQIKLIKLELKLKHWISKETSSIILQRNSSILKASEMKAPPT